MAPNSWTRDDLKQMEAQGIDPAEASRQLELFRHPPPFTQLVRPATVGNGIRLISKDEKERAIERFEAARAQGRFQKFVPASGAASRMFQVLNKELNTPPVLRSVLARRASQGNGDCAKILEFVDSIPRLAFGEQLANVLGVIRPPDWADNIKRVEDLTPYLQALLGPEGLDYARKPKGLIPFHPGAGPVRDPFWEHIAEAERIFLGGPGEFQVHFTVSPEFLAEFNSRAGAASDFWMAKGIRPKLSFSVQKPSTDTLAVDLGDRPFRDERGRLLFRPGGHGALIENLNDLKGDLVFIKNIDNVSTGQFFVISNEWKMVLGGLLLEAEEEARAKGGVKRPIRVCGVVRNTGEPGGGPFWVRGPQGESLQIVESSQVDMNDQEQKRIFSDSTHFNPVDLVCSVRSSSGAPFDLRSFIDPAAVFFSRKSYQGRDLKAFERPGLWNGAMAHWHTLFVEVPLETFNPVKTVLDLLKPAHSNLSDF